MNRQLNSTRWSTRTAAVAAVLSGAVIAASWPGAAAASAATLNVCAHGCAYSQVADAVAAAGNGDTVNVAAGT